jgi:hypothetical protein
MPATSGTSSAKRGWNFTHSGDHESRQTNALEHIAYYLDRIDAHLESIAQSCQSGAVNEGLRMELLTIRELLNQQFPRP